MRVPTLRPSEKWPARICLNWCGESDEVSIATSAASRIQPIWRRSSTMPSTTGPVGRQRMRPARLGVAALQGLGVAVEEQQPRGEVGALAQLAEPAHEVLRHRSRRCGCRCRRPAARPSRRRRLRSSASDRRAAAAARCRRRHSPGPRARSARSSRPAPDRPVTTTNGRRVSRRRAGAEGVGLSACAARGAIMRPRFAPGQGATLQGPKPRTAPGSRTRQVDAQQRLVRRIGQALDPVRRHEIDQQGERRAREKLAARRASRCRRRAPRSGRRAWPAACRRGAAAPGDARSGRRPPAGRRPRSGAARGRTCRRPRARAAARRASSCRGAGRCRWRGRRS